MPNKPGRRPKLDEQKQREFCAMIAAGCPRRSAARYVGVTPRTIRNLAFRDETFAERLRQAEMHKEIGYLRNIHEAGTKYWRASAWALERMFPNSYVRRQPDTVTQEQFRDVIEAMAETMVEVIEDAKLRQRMLRRLNRTLRILDQDDRPSKREPGR